MGKNSDENEDRTDRRAIYSRGYCSDDKEPDSPNYRPNQPRRSSMKKRRSTIYGDRHLNNRKVSFNDKTRIQLIPRNINGDIPTPKSTEIIDEMKKLKDNIKKYGAPYPKQLERQDTTSVSNPRGYNKVQGRSPLVLGSYEGLLNDIDIETYEGEDVSASVKVQIKQNMRVNQLVSNNSDIKGLNQNESNQIKFQPLKQQNQLAKKRQPQTDSYVLLSKQNSIHKQTKNRFISETKDIKKISNISPNKVEKYTNYTLQINKSNKEDIETINNKDSIELMFGTDRREEFNEIERLDKEWEENKWKHNKNHKEEIDEEEMVGSSNASENLSDLNRSPTLAELLAFKPNGIKKYNFEFDYEKAGKSNNHLDTADKLYYMFEPRTNNNLSQISSMRSNKGNRRNTIEDGMESDYETSKTNDSETLFRLLSKRSKLELVKLLNTEFDFNNITLETIDNLTNRDIKISSRKGNKVLSRFYIIRKNMTKNCLKLIKLFWDKYILKLNVDNDFDSLDSKINDVLEQVDKMQLDVKNIKEVKVLDVDEILKQVKLESEQNKKEEINNDIIVDSIETSNSIPIKSHTANPIDSNNINEIKSSFELEQPEQTTEVSNVEVDVNGPINQDDTQNQNEQISQYDTQDKNELNVANIQPIIRIIEVNENFFHIEPFQPDLINSQVQNEDEQQVVQENNTEEIENSQNYNDSNQQNKQDSNINEIENLSEHDVNNQECAQDNKVDEIQESAIQEAENEPIENLKRTNADEENYPSKKVHSQPFGFGINNSKNTNVSFGFGINKNNTNISFGFGNNNNTNPATVGWGRLSNKPIAASSFSNAGFTFGFSDFNNVNKKVELDDIQSPQDNQTIISKDKNENDFSANSNEVMNTIILDNGQQSTNINNNETFIKKSQVSTHTNSLLVPSKVQGKYKKYPISAKFNFIKTPQSPNVFKINKTKSVTNSPTPMDHNQNQDIQQPFQSNQFTVQQFLNHAKLRFEELEPINSDLEIKRYTDKDTKTLAAVRAHTIINPEYKITEKYNQMIQYEMEQLKQQCKQKEEIINSSQNDIINDYLTMGPIVQNQMQTTLKMYSKKLKQQARLHVLQSIEKAALDTKDSYERAKDKAKDKLKILNQHVQLIKQKEEQYIQQETKQDLESLLPKLELSKDQVKLENRNNLALKNKIKNMVDKSKVIQNGLECKLFKINKQEQRLDKQIEELNNSLDSLKQIKSSIPNKKSIAEVKDELELLELHTVWNIQILKDKKIKLTFNNHFEIIFEPVNQYNKVDLNFMQIHMIVPPIDNHHGMNLGYKLLTLYKQYLISYQQHYKVKQIADLIKKFWSNVYSFMFIVNYLQQKFKLELKINDQLKNEKDPIICTLINTYSDYTPNKQFRFQLITDITLAYFIRGCFELPKVYEFKYFYGKYEPTIIEDIFDSMKMERDFNLQKFYSKVKRVIGSN